MRDVTKETREIQSVKGISWEGYFPLLALKTGVMWPGIWVASRRSARQRKWTLPRVYRKEHSLANALNVFQCRTFDPQNWKIKLCSCKQLRLCNLLQQQKLIQETSLVVQWIRIHLPMQGLRFDSWLGN